jgi:hypothetical protein
MKGENVQDSIPHPFQIHLFVFVPNIVASAVPHQLDADIDAMYDQDDQVEAALQPKKKRGKLSKAEKEAEKEAEEAAAAAAAAAAEAAEAEAAAAGPGSSSSSDDEEEVAAAAEAAAADEAEGLEDDDDELNYDFGILGDPAPCVILRLRDNAETRAVWPHKFELYYKVRAAKDGCSMVTRFSKTLLATLTSLASQPSLHACFLQDGSIESTLVAVAMYGCCWRCFSLARAQWLTCYFQLKSHCRSH